MWMPFESLVSLHFTRPAKDHFLQRADRYPGYYILVLIHL